MGHCPWCERYIKRYSSNNGTLSEDELEQDRERIKNGFWASIVQVDGEHFLANKVLNLEDALKKRMPVQVDTASGRAVFGRFWCCSVAEQKDKVLNEALEHFWFLSGGCGMSWTTPICCELASATSSEEQLEWEKENFPDIADLTAKLENQLKNEA